MVARRQLQMEAGAHWGKWDETNPFHDFGRILDSLPSTQACQPGADGAAGISLMLAYCVGKICRLGSIAVEARPDVPETVTVGSPQ
jgi:hypothetical protein